MNNIDLDLNTKLIKTLLEIYSEITGLSIEFYICNKKKSLYSIKQWPKFCEEFCSIYGKNAIIKNKGKITGLHQCPAGLWCYSKQIKVEGKIIGTFIIGHRRIFGKENKSEKVLTNFLNNNIIKSQMKERLIKLFHEVEIVHENDFNIDLLNRLSFIEQYVTLEHQRAANEHKRIEIFKEQSVNLAHHFLLPIQSIIANAENLVNEADNELEFRIIAEDVLEEVIKLSYIAENIRGSVLEDRDEFGYEFHQIELFPIILETVDLFRKEAKNKGVLIKDPVEKNIPIQFVEASEPHIKQVLFNIINNAVKYSFVSTAQHERFIEVHCFSEKKYYCIQVTNYGIGIESEEILEGLIFLNGYRGKLARDRSRLGSGAGLSIVKKILEKHNGYIEIESELKGFGIKIDPYKTTVKVCIPFYQHRRTSNGAKKNIMD